MVKGDAWTPARFWSYVTAYSPEQEKELRKEGYVKAN